MEVNGQLHDQAVFLGKGTHVALWTGGMEGRSDHSMEKKNLLSLLGVES
jgi:hypothetical protein